MNKEYINNLPPELTKRRQWIATAGKKPTGGTGYNLPENWQEFDKVSSCQYPGFYLDGGGIICLDFDKVARGRGMSRGAREIIGTIHATAGQTYTEKSCSGKGLHMFYKLDRIPLDFPHAPKIKLDGGGVLEVYTQKHYIAVTGDRVGTTSTVTGAPPALLDLIRERAAVKVSTPGKEESDARPLTTSFLTVEQIPDVIRHSKSGNLFVQLFDAGRVDGPATDYTAGAASGFSEADAALFLLIAPYCGPRGGDLPTMLDVFKQSALYPSVEERKRGHVADYLERTARAALEHWDKWYYGKPSQEGNAERLDGIQFPVWDTTGKKPRLIAAHWKNVAALLRGFGIRARYNLMSKSVEISGTIGLDSLDGMSADAATTTIRGAALVNGLRINERDLDAALLKIAERDKYSPVQDYLRAALDVYQATGDADYVGEMFGRLDIDPDFIQYRDSYRALFNKWCIGAARIAFNTLADAGTVQGVLVLQGPGGTGKSTFVRTLAPAQSWVLPEGSLNPYDKDSMITALSHWIVELSEMGETMKKERQDKLKQFFTAPRDEIRVPYGRKAESRPRMTAFIGTTNDRGILKDPTGNRRYWIIPVINIQPMPDTEDFLRLFWGQVMYKATVEHESDRLTAAERDALEHQNEVFENLTDEEQKILDLLDWDAPREKWQRMTATAISGLICGGGRVRMVGKALRHIARMGYPVGIPKSHKDRCFTIPPITETPLL